jgi:hypothetical protein
MRRKVKVLSPIQLLRAPTVRAVGRKLLYKLAHAEFMADRTTCERCGCRAKLDCHHKIGRVGSRLWDTRYFAALCRTCHNTIEYERASAIRDGWLIVLTNEQERERKETCKSYSK